LMSWTSVFHWFSWVFHEFSMVFHGFPSPVVWVSLILPQTHVGILHPESEDYRSKT
jgi:hypothetical protein